MSDKKLATGADGWPTSNVDEQLVINAVAKSLGVRPEAVSQQAQAQDPSVALSTRTSETEESMSPTTARMQQLQQMHHPNCQHHHNDCDDDSIAAEASSSSSGPPIDPKILRGYNWSPPLPWSTFLRLRRSWGQIKLTPQQEENVFKALEKSSSGKIHEALPFVSAFIDKHCPELRHKNLAVPRPGATFMLLAVITGNVELCRRCLELGASPNSCRFLTDQEAPENQMRHGYSPMFLACICEQLEIMELLRQHGGSIHIIDRWGRTPLHAAAAMGSSEVLRWLIKEGAPRKVVDVDLQMPGELCVGKVIPQLAQPSILFMQPSASREPLYCTCCRERDDDPPSSSPQAASTEGEGEKGKTTAAKLEMGRCGCVDDMYTRWYSDRLRSTWSTTFTSVRDNCISKALPSAPNPTSPVTQEAK